MSVCVAPRGFGLGACSPKLGLYRILKRHDLLSHGDIVITEIDEMGGKAPALVPPEAVRFFAVKLLKHLNTSLYVCDAVFSGKRNYF